MPVIKNIGKFIEGQPMYFAVAYDQGDDQSKPIIRIDAEAKKVFVGEVEIEPWSVAYRASLRKKV